ncbi:amino acid permease [Streptomyces sp. WZ-12]|uniref:amino acid permease n=1 Tax=Streptomyces sp. WZ-12 TaxID=3030210 RepID=UPI0023810D0C|nr:amino acid permease [Streptomyces sp. WZ-12]
MTVATSGRPAGAPGRRPTPDGSGCTDGTAGPDGSEGGRPGQPAPAGRELKQRHLTLMALGGAVGTGLFLGCAQTIRSAGPAAVLSYALAGLLVILVMRMLGEMVVARPMAGSFADYARLALGDWAGFTIGWLYWYAFVAIVAIEAIAGGRIVHGWLPGVPVWAVSVVLLTAMAVVNLCSTGSFGSVEFWLAIVKIGAIVGFLALGTAYVCGFWPGGGSPHLGHFVDHGGFLPNGPGAVLAATVVVVFAFGGTEIVTIAAAESPDPRTAVARATRQVLWRVLVFFLGSIFLVVAIVPWDTVTGTESPYATAMARMGVPFAGTVMTAVILAALLSVLNSTLYASSRMLTTLCRHGEAPRALARTNRRGAPARALLLGTVMGYLSIGAQVLQPERTFGFLLDSTGAVLIFLYVTIAVSQLRLGTRARRTEPHRLTFRMWAHPHLTWLTIAALLAILLSMALFADTRPQLLMSLGSLGVVLLAYGVRRAVRRMRRVRQVSAAGRMGAEG